MHDTTLIHAMLKSTGRVIWISDITKRNRHLFRGNIRCKECKEDLDPVIGDKRIHHFRHQKGSNCTGGGPMTAIHLFCQEYLMNNLPYTSFRDCNSCNKSISFTDNCVPKYEYRIKLEGKSYLAIDVGILVDGKLKYAIEVHNTCKSTEKKKQYLLDNDIQLIEFNSSNFLKHKFGTTDVSYIKSQEMPKDTYVSDRYNIQTCSDCIEKAHEAERLLNERRNQIAIIRENERLEAYERDKKQMERRNNEQIERIRIDHERRKKKAIADELYELECKKKQEEKRKELQYREEQNQILIERTKKNKSIALEITRKECGCGITLANICYCSSPVYILSINNSYWCKNCDCWKCRC